MPLGAILGRFEGAFARDLSAVLAFVGVSDVDRSFMRNLWTVCVLAACKNSFVIYRCICNQFVLFCHVFEKFTELGDFWWFFRFSDSLDIFRLCGWGSLRAVCEFRREFSILLDFL